MSLNWLSHFWGQVQLHTKMDKVGAQRILKLFDKAHPLLMRARLLGQLPPELEQPLRSTTALWRFQEDVREFLCADQLSTDLTDALGWWEKFLYQYAGIVEDCPLELRGGSELKHISHVVVNKVGNPVPLRYEDQECVLFSVRWHCFGKDGRKGYIDTMYVIP